MASTGELDLTLVTVGVGAAASPRFAPAGLLVEFGRSRVLIDGGPTNVPDGRFDAWLVTDEHSELIAAIRRKGLLLGLTPQMTDYRDDGLRVELHPVVHTSHAAGGYVISGAGHRVVWAPEFWVFPSWAAGADLMFAEASGWTRPIRFTGGVGGHLNVPAVAAAARSAGVRRLVFAHIGRPTIRAMDAGLEPAFGEFGQDGQTYRLKPTHEAPSRESIR